MDRGLALFEILALGAVQVVDDILFDMTAIEEDDVVGAHGLGIEQEGL